MQLFGSAPSFLGLDLSTSTIKIVELVDRKKRIELTTYAQANLPNLLLHAGGTDEEDVVRRTTNVVTQMIEKSQANSEFVVLALPSSIVFSTVLMLPEMADAEMDKAVRVAARDVVPLDIEQMVLGWSRLGHQPHMSVKSKSETDSKKKETTNGATQSAVAGASANIPVFVTAAPQDVVSRYLRLMELLKLQLYALEVETFPLARSLLNRLTDTAMIIDIGAQATSFHIIDRGTPRVSHSMEYGGKNITQLLMQALSIDEGEAETLKTQHGLSPSLPDRAGPALQGAVLKIAEQAKRVLESYHEQSHHTLNKTIVIGGGALMKGLPEIITQFLGHSVTVGNPWRGLSYPEKLEQRLHVLGPQYTVAVGLALRGFEEQK